MFMSRPQSSGSVQSQASLLENETAHVSNEENVADETEKDGDGRSKWSACSFEKSAIIGTLITIILVGLFVIALDISIDKVRRTDEAEYYKSFVNNSLTLQGTPEEYAVFYPLSYHEANSIRRVDMNYVQLNISEFVDSFKYTRKPESIKFRNMRFVGKVSKSLRIGFTDTYRPGGDSMAMAGVMIVEFNQSIGPFTIFQLDQCDKCILNAADRDNLAQFQDVDCLKSALMLPLQNSESYYLISKDLELKSRMKVKVFGWNFFDLDPMAGSLTSQHTDSEKILQDLIRHKVSLKQLHLRNCQIQLSTLSSFSSTITHLTLDTVNITSATGRLSEIFSNFTQLQELTLNFGNGYRKSNLSVILNTLRHHPLDSSKVETRHSFTVDLTDLPSTLKVLRLSNVIISGQSYKPPVLRVHLHLKLLVIQGVIFDDQQSWDMIQDSHFLKYDEFAWQNLNSHFANFYIDAKVETLSSSHTELQWLAFVKRKTSVRDTTKWVFLDNVFSREFSDRKSSEMTVLLEYFGKLELEDLFGPVDTNFGPVLLQGQAPNSTGPIQWQARHIYPAERTSIWFKVSNMEIFLDKNSMLTSAW